MQAVSNAVQDTSSIVQDSVPDGEEGQTPLQQFVDSLKDKVLPSEQTADSAQQATQSVAESLPDSSSQLKEQVTGAAQSVSDSVPDSSQVQDQVADAGQSFGQAASGALQPVGGQLPQGNDAPEPGVALLRPIGLFDFFNGVKGRVQTPELEVGRLAV